ncbi:hypothetical protein [Mycobacterium sp. SM1]|nr:hypothetical protein [Mycobacterium sp. SM1]
MAALAALLKRRLAITPVTGSPMCTPAGAQAPSVLAKVIAKNR